jgi:hypothetical protein
LLCIFRQYGYYSPIERSGNSAQVGSYPEVEKNVLHTGECKYPVCSGINDPPIRTNGLGDMRCRDLNSVAHHATLLIYAKTILKKKPHNKALGGRIGKLPQDFFPHVAENSLDVYIYTSSHLSMPGLNACEEGSGSVKTNTKI